MASNAQCLNHNISGDTILFVSSDFGHAIELLFRVVIVIDEYCR